MLVEAYDEAALSERSCREWFQKLRTVNLTLKTKNVAESRKCTKTRNLEALLDEDLCQTQEALALTLGVTQPAISHRLTSLGMI